MLPLFILSFLVASIHSQSLVHGENGQICTNWQLAGATIQVSIDSSPCSGPIGYEFGMSGMSMVIRFCCPSNAGTTKPPVVIQPPPNSCGRSSVAPKQTRIVGGHQAKEHSWPWLVSLQQNGGHFCGGTLIDERHVVTAAHCLQDRSVYPQLTIVAGLHHQANPNSGKTQRVRVERVFNHELYDDKRFTHDIALLRLAEPVSLNQFVNVICLPGKDPELHGQVWIAGWGTTSFGGHPSNELLQAQIHVMDQCKNVYQFDESKQVCAGNAQYSKDSCQGDSGGPLMHEVNGQWILSGAVSYGHECAKEHHPGIYTRVSGYLDWIRSKMY